MATRRAQSCRLVLCFLMACAGAAFAQSVPCALDLPARSAAAPSASAFVAGITSFSLAERESAICEQAIAGNVPDFLREFCPVSICARIAETTHTATLYVAPDYLAIGSDAEHFFAPLTPRAAQRLAERLGCVMPTPKMVDAIWRQAAVRFEPEPIAPSSAMTTVPVFARHSALVCRQRLECLAEHPLGALVAGSKKDVVLTPRLESAPGKVAIYGWHRPNGEAIQPLYLGHTENWVDYSHGVRLVSQRMSLDGAPTEVSRVLADAELNVLLSDEGPLAQARYQEKETDGEFRAAARFDERTLTYSPAPQVRVHINAPNSTPTLLYLYALPNGNTIEQTIGMEMRPGLDWRFGIQHIGAQTRRLREAMPGERIAIAYLEAEQKSWPAWKSAHPDSMATIRRIVDSVLERLDAPDARLALTGHSGGGSFIFGYLDGADRIDDRVERVSFLDSNYSYSEEAGHAEKIAEWLERRPTNCLNAICYDDRNVLFQGKRVVGPNGGTWRRTEEMVAWFGARFDLEEKRQGELVVHRGLGGRIEIIQHTNPENKILHTALVGDMSGFIQSMTSGTDCEGKAGTFGGPIAYAKWIDTE